jgi:hypothetical protein
VAQTPNYSDEDIRQILNLAASRQDGQGMSSDLLRRSAAELGISEEHLAAAEEEYRAQKERISARAKFEAKRKEEFFRSLGTFLIVNCLLAYLSIRDHDTWFLWVLGFWGLSMVQRAWSVFGPNRDVAFDEWRKKQSSSRSAQQVLDEYREKTGDVDLTEKLQAIAYLRDHMGMDLVEAKNTVETQARNG